VTVHRGGTVKRYDGTAGDIFTPGQRWHPGRAVTAHALTTAAPVDGEG
jgi:hypothetical protein